jgi:signal transduction histidine kinase/CheY-like chemotaxis protein
MTPVRLQFNHVAMAVALMVTVIVGASLWAERSIPAGLLPHGVCFTWLPALLWLHVISDALIGLAYLSIPVSLLYLVTSRRDLPFNWMFLLFGLFIVSCGFTHLVGIWTIWHPDYWFAGSLKAMTAAVSVFTAVALLPLVPKALALPTTAQLRRANERLEREAATRLAVEEELRQARALLERRVADRTQELALARATAEQLRAEAEHANSMKDKFLAKVSHELRTPLQATLSWAGVLASQVAKDSPAHTAATRIEHNVAAQARLIDDLLDISRILSGKLKLDLQSVQVREVVERAVTVVGPLAQKAGVTIDADIALDDVEATTDPGRLEQVLWNLLSNAVHASSAGQRVRLVAHARGGRLMLRVQDEGRGIEPAAVATLFEPFRQANVSNTHRGLGLGLAITRSIVGLFGGTVVAHSDGPDRGATFSVDMPLVAGLPVHDRAPALSAQEVAALLRINVLYVEDNQEIADAVVADLQGWVGRVDVAYTYADAVTKAAECAYDVLVSDLNLGARQTGYDLLRELRSQHRFVAPAVAVSAFGSDEDLRRSREAGFRVHLTKPFSAADLAQAIARVVLGQPADSDGPPP